MPQKRHNMDDPKLKEGLGLKHLPLIRLPVTKEKINAVLRQARSMRIWGVRWSEM